MNFFFFFLRLGSQLLLQVRAVVFCSATYSSQLNNVTDFYNTASSQVTFDSGEKIALKKLNDVT